MRVRRLGLIAIHVLSCASLLAQGQSDLPQFRAGVELVQLDVAVLDSKRTPVRGLTAADFTVLENGVARPIRAFTPVELAPRTRSTEAVWAETVPLDVVSNQAGQQDGRLVMILMDRSIPVGQPTLAARRIATTAVEALGAHDLAAVVSTSNGAVQNLTADRTRLLRAINYGDPSTGISPEQEAIMGKLDPLQDGRCLCGLCVLETITRVADAVQGTPRRRKVLFFIGSSVIWQSSRPVAAAAADVGCEMRLKDARKTMFAAVDRANLTVHSLDPQGLVNIGPQTRAGAGGGFDRPVNSGPTERLRRQQVETTDAMAGQQSLEVLPDRTGGRTVVSRNNPSEAVPEIFRESEAYYVLGVERDPSDRTQSPRSIEVKVGRRGLRVYAQRQYVVPTAPVRTSVAAAASGTSTSNQDALNRLLPSAGLPLALAVTAFASPSPESPKAVVRIDVDAGAFARGDRTAVPLEIAVMAVDQTGRPVASARQTSTIPVSGVARDRAAELNVPAHEINVQSHLELAPGDYGVRVAVSDAATGTVASVFSDVIVPPFDSAALSLSSVAVDIASTTTAAPVPTTRRVFRRGERVRALLQIYQGTGRTEPVVPVSMRVRILDAKGAAVRDQSLPFTEKMFTNRRADCILTIPVQNLPPGDYLLRLEASVGRETTGRALRFTVE